MHLKAVYVFLLITLLLLVLASIAGLVYSLDLNNFEMALDAAETFPGFCNPGQTLCDWNANNNLTPSTFSATYDTNTALVLLDLIGRMEYQTATPSSPPNFSLVAKIQDGDSPNFVGIWKNADSLYVIFRGTKTASEWQQDLNVAQVPFQNNPDVLVHQGFLTICNQVMPQILQVIVQENPTNVFLAGHSLGAAVATIAGTFLSQPRVVYAFASPLVGNAGFVALVDSQYPVFRVSNRDDVVTLIPLAVMINTSGNHAPWNYARAGTDHSFSRNWGSWQNNHFIPMYINCLTENQSNPASCDVTEIP